MEKSNPEKQLIPKESQNLIQEALDWLGSIESITITNDKEFDNAHEVCKDVKKKFNKLEKERKAITGPMNNEIRKINSEFKVVTEKLSSFESAAKKAISDYHQKKEQLRLEEQRKLNAKAEEQKRKADVAAQKELEKAEQYRKEGKDHLADKAEARAEAKLITATQTVAPVIGETKVKGTSFRKKYVCEVEDKSQFVAFCANNMTGPMVAFYNQLEINLKGLEKLANSSGGALQAPGIKYRVETGVSMRT